MIQKLKQKFSRGSILAFSLIIMGIILVSAIGIATVSVSEQKGAGSTAKSTQSFQVANSASELLLQQAKNNSNSPLSNIGGGWNCDPITGNVTNSSVVGGNAEIAFYASEENSAPQIRCDSGQTLSAVKKIKAVGTYAGTTRAIEVAVATGCVGGVKVIASSGGANFTPTDYSKIHNFVTQNEGELKGFWCRYTLSGRIFTSYSNINNRVHFDDGDIMFNPTTDSSVSKSIGSFGCADGDVCTYWWAGNGGSTCASGWAVLGSCTCPSNSC